MIFRWVILFYLLGASMAADAGSSVPAGPPAGFSSLARAVWKAAGREWMRSEEGAFFIYAGSTGEVAQARTEADLAWEALDSWLGKDPAPRPALLFIIDDRSIWDRVLRGADRRKDSLAIQADDEIFILREPSAPSDPARLPHELVHLKLWRRYESRVPLWLDEGLASYLGWRAADRIAWKRGLVLTRNKAVFPPAQLRPLADIQAVRSYGEMPPAFYRQAEEMVAAVARQAGDESLGEFARVMVEEGLSWEEYLAAKLGLPQSDLDRIQQEVTGLLEQKAKR